MEIFKIILIGFLGTIFCVVLKETRKDISMIVALVTVAIIMAFGINYISQIVDVINEEDETETVCNVSMNLRIIELDGTVVFDSNSSSASSWNDNVKMFTVNFASGGLYKFELYFTTRDGTTISGFENNINATMIVTCKCENPLITKERESGGTNECIDCANCNYYLEEIWYGDVHEEVLSTGTVSFVMQYDYDNLTNPTSICCSNFSVEFEALDTSLTVAIIPETGNKSYTSTGWTEYRKFMIMIYNPNSSASPTTFYVDVTIEYDSFALTYYLYG